MSPTDQALAARAGRILGVLEDTYPEATTELSFSNPFELLVATVLSAQTTDVRVNLVTPALFARFPDARSLAAAEPAELEELIHSTGFFKQKAKSLIGLARLLVERHAGEVPPDIEALVALPGVGRKTANVVLGTAFGMASGVVVDTHVARVSRRLGLSTGADPERIEQELMALFPAEAWISLSHGLILHGRRICTARRPDCPSCPLARYCPKIGVA